MKTNIIISLAVVLILFGCNNDPNVNSKNKIETKKKDKTPLDNFDLIGNVKELREIKHVEILNISGNFEVGKGQKPSGYEQPDFKILFNKRGNVTENILYNSDGSLKKKFTYKYDDMGNMIEGNIFKSDGSLKEKSTARYDENGNVIERNIFKSDGSLKEKSTHRYDENGNVIEWNDYGRDSILTGKSTSRYDENGNMIEEITYYSFSIHEFKITYKYDKKGKMLEKNEYNNSTNSLEKSSFYKYDRNGNKKERITYTYDLDGNRIYDGKHTYKYDAKGNKIQWKMFRPNRKLKPVLKYTYKYDAKGIIKEENRYDAFAGRNFTSCNIKFIYIYEFDNNGNCIKRICIEKAYEKNNSTTRRYITERAITYY